MIVEDIIVDETYRQRGLGTSLVRLAEKITQERGCRAIELSSDMFRAETHRFWEVLGYDRLAYQFRKVIKG